MDGTGALRNPGVFRPYDLDLSQPQQLGDPADMVGVMVS